MKKFLKNRRLLLILSTFIVAVVILAASVSLRGSHETPFFAQRFSNNTVAIAAKVVNWPFEKINEGIEKVVDLVNTYKENDYLEQKVDSLAQTKVRNSNLEKENKQLKDTLKLKASLTDYELIVGSVVSRAPTSWSDLVIIDLGLNSGLKKNMAVMSGNGLVGRVIEVNDTTSKVELITTTDKSASRFAVELKVDDDTYAHGIITGYDEKSGNLLLSQVANSKAIKKGTKVYTSGLAGRSPKGLLVGSVKKTTKDSFGLTDIIQIKPATDLNNFSVVAVVNRKVSGE